MSAPNDLLKAMEEASVAVATLTGIKRQFIDAGWTDEAAEQLVIAMLHQNGGDA